MIVVMKLARLIVILCSFLAFASSTPAQTTGAKKAPADSAKSAKKAAAPEASSLLDINRASETELKTLPGIGDAYAAAIVKNRPYQNKTQLLSKKVVPSATYAKIRDKVIAKQ
jgi:competence protein ComEA